MRTQKHPATDDDAKLVDVSPRYVEQASVWSALQDAPGRPRSQGVG